VATKLLFKGALCSESGAPGISHKRADRVQGASVTGSAVTVSGLTLVEMSGSPFCSDPVETAITVSGTVSVNLWGSESATTTNARFRLDLHVYRAGAQLASFFSARMAAELTTTNAVRTFTGTPTSTNLQVGDRIVVRVYAEENTSGTAMGTGTVTHRYNGAAAADGDSFISLTETLRLTKIRTVKSSFGDYTTLTAWEAGEQRDLTNLGPALCEIADNINDVTAVTIDGWTTTATDYIRVYTLAANRHAGVYDASKYKLDVNTTGVSSLVNMESYTRIEGLQVAQRHATGSQAIAVGYAGAGDVRIESCLVPQANGANGHGILVTGGAVLVRNCVVYGCQVIGIGQLTSVAAPALTLQNCTVAKCDTGVYVGDSTLIATNVYTGGNTTNDYANAGTLTCTTCMHSSSATVTGSTGNVAHSTANFTNVTAGSEDYHLVTGSALIGQGTDLSGSFTVDIDGQTRAAPWDIGADEVLTAAQDTPELYGRPGGLSGQRQMTQLLSF